MVICASLLSICFLRSASLAGRKSLGDSKRRLTVAPPSGPLNLLHYGAHAITGSSVASPPFPADRMRNLKVAS
jgi:hypothetical protein